MLYCLSSPEALAGVCHKRMYHQDKTNSFSACKAHLAALYCNTKWSPDYGTSLTIYIVVININVQNHLPHRQSPSRMPSHLHPTHALCLPRILPAFLFDVKQVQVQPRIDCIINASRWCMRQALLIVHLQVLGASHPLICLLGSQDRLLQPCYWAPGI